MAEQIAFAIAAIGALGFGVGVVFFRDAFRAAVSLIGTLLSVALLFIVLEAPFVAALQVIVYAGAIVVLFLPEHTAADTNVGSPASIGHAFLNQHIVAFEVTSLIMLIAAVGAVILAKRAVMLEGGR